MFKNFAREFHDLNLRDVDEFILAFEFVNDEFDHAADNRIRDKRLLGDEINNLRLQFPKHNLFLL